MWRMASASSGRARRTEIGGKDRRSSRSARPPRRTVAGPRGAPSAACAAGGELLDGLVFVVGRRLEHREVAADRLDARPGGPFRIGGEVDDLRRAGGAADELEDPLLDPRLHAEQGVVED